ncbi:MAG: signal peptide peptidase SppA [Novosphingobium sp.]|nr:signal peptide peptidase SppA [Novosphingobium sp.]
MIFARKVWKLLVAIKDGLALLFLLLFFIAIYAVLTMRPNVGAVRDGALLLELNGTIVEEPSLPDPLEFLVAREAPLAEYSERDIIRALRAAAKDGRIKAVVLDLSRFVGGGMVHLQEVGAAMDEVRAAKKPVLAYASYYGDDGLLLAAHASEVWVHPFGGAFVAGSGGKNLYYGGLLEKLKITAHVFRVGTFKSAVEPWIRNDQSPEAREASKALYGALWEDWKADVAKARPSADIALVSTDPVGWLKASGGDAAKAAKAAHLVDRIGDRTDFGERVAELVGKDPTNPAPGGFAHTPLGTWLAANKPTSSGKAIGVVTISGEIVDGEAGPGLAGGDRIARLLNEALNQNFAALVVRIDSPGGSMAAAEEIRAAIERYRKQDIPIVASMANLGASGGYWVATPASRIFAEPGTITGSIGVFAVVPTFERALSDYGVTTDGVQTTPLSGQPDLIGGLAPEVSAMLQANVESGYSRFVGLVGKARGKTPEQVDRIGQGRVWDGGTARQLGLVDQFGGLDDALTYAAKAAKLEDGEWHAVFLGDGADPLATLLQHMRSTEAQSNAPRGGSDWAAMAAGRQNDLVARLLTDVERITATRGVQAYCLECTSGLPVIRENRPRQPLSALLARRFGLTGE